MKMKALSIIGVFSLGWLASAIDPPRSPRQPLGNGTRILTYEETVVRRQLSARSQSVSWFRGDVDGLFVSQSGGSLTLENIATGQRESFVSPAQYPSGAVEYWIRPDLKKIMFATNYTSQYRYSYFSDYMVLDRASNKTSPVVNNQAGDIQYAEQSPVGDTIAFVRGNNLYLNKDGIISQITHDGGPDMFHGIPDWVYEEEVIEDRKTLWFSPDGEFLAYLSFNETGVEKYTVPYYMSGDKFAPSYPRELNIRYPKVGTTNPRVQLSILNIKSEKSVPVNVDTFDPEDLVIGEVAWVTEKHSSLIYRTFNRVQDHEKLVRLDIENMNNTLVRERKVTDGWLDHNKVITYIASLRGSTEDYYLDYSDESGWNHLYLYPIKGGPGKALTSGTWEVTSILHVDSTRELVYYLSTQRHSTERHLYSVSYATGEKRALVDDTVPAVWSASFSSAGGFYILSYRGPDVPYQELYAINSATPLRVVTDNKALWDGIKDYKLPNITYFDLEHPDGYSLNVMQRLPANFDPSKKYPVLFLPYGGPGSQEVSKTFQSHGWAAYISSDPELEYITYTVDNRGTGMNGRKFRSWVSKGLGKFETIDQIWAAQQLASQFEFIDELKIGIFGWSYGGYLAAKVVEANSGIFSLGLIVAPVSDFRFYDTLYTERFMKTYEMNPSGYDESAVRKVEGFQNIAGGFTIMHGLGDDNVHYQNTAALVDLLVGGGVSPEKMRWFAFTDSDHGISYNNAQTFLYKYLTDSLYREKIRKPDSTKHQWSKVKVDAKFNFDSS
jgi:dipeptidyl-peptidase 4